jgi:hypothetical protein
MSRMLTLLVVTLAASACASKDSTLAARLKRQIEASISGARVEVRGPRELLVVRGDQKVEKYLDNLARECERGEPECDAAIERHVRGTKELLGIEGSVAGLLPQALLATLKNDVWVEQARARVSRPSGPGEPDRRSANQLVTRPFKQDMHIVLVGDYETSMRMVRVAELEGLRVDRAAAFDLAMSNLARLERVEGIRIEEGVPIFVIETKDSYGSARLLLLDRWRTRAQSLPGRLVAAAPTRDIVLYTTDRYPQAVAAMAEIAAGLVTTMPYALSRALLRLGDEGWEPYQQQLE